MGVGSSRNLAAALLALGMAASLPGASSAAAESWAARCSGAGDAQLCVQAALQDSERALIAAVSERRTELRSARGADPFAVEQAQVQWLARTQNRCAGAASQAADFDLAFAQCLADFYEARLAELRAVLN